MITTPPLYEGAYGPLRWVAKLEAAEHQVTVETVGRGSGKPVWTGTGTGSVRPGSGRYEKGANASFLAEADDGSVFSGWSGCDRTSPSGSLGVEGDTCDRPGGTPHCP